MGIEYSLIPNHLTDNPDDYMAMVQGQVSHTEEEIIEEMLDRGDDSKQKAAAGGGGKLL